MQLGSTEATRSPGRRPSSSSALPSRAVRRSNSTNDSVRSPSDSAGASP
jgi:hypothetical protein